MNSQDVSKAIRRYTRPTLEEVGFTQFTARKAWRHLPGLVHVIDFQSLGHYLGQSLNTTSFSFGIDIGIQFTATSKYPWFGRVASEAPPRPGGHLTKSLRKRLNQPELPRPDVWYVDPNGENLPEVVRDARDAVLDQAMPWLEKYSDEAFALGALETRPDTFYEPGILNEDFGGVVGSLGRAMTASVLALELGDKKHAIEIWRNLLKNPYYELLDDIRRDAQANIKWIEEGH